MGWVVSRLLLTIVIALSLPFATASGDVFVRATFGTSTFQGTASSVQLSVNDTRTSHICKL